MTDLLKQKAEQLKTWLALAHEEWKKEHEGYDLSEIPEDDNEELRF